MKRDPDGNSVNPSATQPVRRFQWWGWLSTIGGYISGNGYVWPFNAGWQSHLNTQGAQDMARLNAFIRSIAWYNLVPSGLGGMRTLVTAGGSSVSASDYVAAAATPDGKLLVAYIPPAHNGSITVDMAAMSGPASARWFDPTSGAYSDAGTGLANSGTRVFTPPGTNSAGANDWVLVLQVGATRFDFNGDGKSDILWRNTSTGQNGDLADERHQRSSTGDYRRSSRTPTGRSWAWAISTATARATSCGATPAPGRTAIWLMNGLSGQQHRLIAGRRGHRAGRSPGVGDFNGDGKSDILWRNASTGQHGDLADERVHASSTGYIAARRRHRLGHRRASAISTATARATSCGATQHRAERRSG